MRELKIGEKTIRVRATALALLYYEQEFGKDLLAELAKMKSMAPKPGESIESTVARLDVMSFLKITWTMAKADKYGEKFPGFEGWLFELGEINLIDPSFMLAALEEAGAGFLGKGKGK